MVICDDPAFLFIHVPKAAGTSIAGAFAHVDLMRAAKAHKDPEKRKKWIEAKGFPEEVLDLPTHATASQVRDTLGEHAFVELFRFAVVRNPWDVELSWYTYNLQTATAPHHQIVSVYKDFNDYVRRYLEDHGTLLAPGPQTKYVFDEHGALLVDQVLRYENLTEEFAGVVENLGLSDVVLDQFNQSYHAPWTEAYDTDTFDLVKEIAAPDCEAFGYSGDAQVDRES